MASTLPAVRAAVKAGLGVTARPVEMMSPDLRVLGAADGLPPLPDTEYLLCRDPNSQNELAMVIFHAMESYQNPWHYNQFSAEGGDDPLMVEGVLSSSQAKALSRKCKEPLAMKNAQWLFFVPICTRLTAQIVKVAVNQPVAIRSSMWVKITRTSIL